MAEKSSKSAGVLSMSAAFSAIDRARFMVLSIGGPRPFGDTKESWCASVARALSTRTLSFTPRRVRALLGNEKIRLSADEYVRIEALYRGADEALETISGLARDADLRRAAFGEDQGNRDEG